MPHLPVDSVGGPIFEVQLLLIASPGVFLRVLCDLLFKYELCCGLRVSSLTPPYGPDLDRHLLR